MEVNVSPKEMGPTRKIAPLSNKFTLEGIRRPENRGTRIYKSERELVRYPVCYNHFSYVRTSYQLGRVWDICTEET